MFGFDDLALGALSMGGSLLSGLGASQSASKANKRAANLQAWADQENHALGEQIKKVYAPSQIPLDAASAGFNPVTYLGAMGGSYGAMWQMGWGLEQRHAPQQQAVPSTLSAIGGAITAGADSLSSSLATNKKIEAQQEGLATYLASVQQARSRGNPMAGLGTPAFSTAGPRTGGGGAVAALSMDVGGSSDGFKVKMPEITDLSSLWGGFDRTRADAGSVMQRNGMILGEVAGIANTLADTYRSFFPKGADPSRDYGFGTRFNPNAANDRVPLPFPWSSAPTGALSPNRAPYQPAPGTSDWEQAVNPPLFGW